MTRTLDQLLPGESATVTGLDMESAARQRLVSLGFVPGQPVTALLRSCFGDPTAYRIMDTVIALRCSDARHIHIH